VLNRTSMELLLILPLDDQMASECAVNAH